jgi:hypothetical protein
MPFRNGWIRNDNHGWISFIHIHPCQHTFAIHTWGIYIICTCYFSQLTTFDCQKTPQAENTSSMWMFAQNSNHTFEKSQQTSEKKNRHRIHGINKKIHQTKRTVCLGSTVSLLNLRKLDKCFSLLHKN